MSGDTWDRIVNGGLLLMAFVTFMYPLHLKNKQRAEAVITGLKKLRKWAKKHEAADADRFKVLFDCAKLPNGTHADTKGD